MFDDVFIWHQQIILPTDRVVCHPSRVEQMEILLERQGLLGKTKVEIDPNMSAGTWVSLPTQPEQWRDFVPQES
jgi:hypothetical protein